MESALINRFGVFGGGRVVVALVVLVGCAKPIDREEATPADVASPGPTVQAPATPTVVPPPPPTLTATPSVTPSPTASPTVGPTDTASATPRAPATATVSAPRTATPTATAAPSPTRTPSRVPTATSVPTATATTVPTASATPIPPLGLDVRGPADGSSVTSDAVVVHGSTSPGATVTINGAAVTVATDGEFRAEVALSPGDNTIEVVAADASGDRKSVVLTVVSLVQPPQPFILVVTEPRDQSIVSEGTIRLSGRTGTDAIVTVQGVGIEVDAVGVFSTTVTLDEGPNVIDVVATDADGRVLSTVIAVIYRPKTGG